MRTLLRFLITSTVAGLMLASVLVALAPEVKAVLASPHTGQEHGLSELEELSQRSLVYSREGRLLAVLHAEENRSPVPLARVPRPVVNAILDTEDERFWQHGGVDLRSTGRALLTNLESGQIEQGGSTITQQLVKNALLTPERSVDRKVREAVLAVRLEDRLTKRQILERYLNTVYFGGGAYGVQAAAETYFGTDVTRLTVADGAFLAGLIRNPVGYDPIRYPKLARERRDLALDRMVAMDHLSPERAAQLKKTPLPTARLKPLPPPNDYFVEEVKQRLLDDRRLGETPQERYNAVFKGGLRIYTSLDQRMQRLAEEKVTTMLPRLVGKSGRFSASLITLEPGTGMVRAMVAGPGFEKVKFNLATQGKRQPGSSFKVFVLVAALEAGYGPRHSINGTSPCPVKQGAGKPWHPANYDGATGGGVMSLTTATAKSVNCAYVRLGLKVGLDKVAAVAKKMGITTHLDPFPAMSLGSEEVKGIDMASAFGVLANDGIRHAPTFVERVFDRDGKLLFRGPDKGKRVVSAQNARVAVQILKSVVSGGTAARASLPGRQVAGKTGTSQNHENAWFVGFTPQLATAVWMGSPKGNISMGGMTGGHGPAPIFGAFMREAMEGMAAVPFPAPDPKLIPRGGFISDPPEARGSIACGPDKPGSEPSAATSAKCRPTTTVQPDVVIIVPPQGAPVTSPPSTAPPAETTSTTAGRTETSNHGPPQSTTSTSQPPNG